LQRRQLATSGTKTQVALRLWNAAKKEAALKRKEITPEAKAIVAKTGMNSKDVELSFEKSLVAKSIMATHATSDQVAPVAQAQATGGNGRGPQRLNTLKAKKASDLKVALDSRKMDTTGTKDEMAQRLWMAFEQNINNGRRS
jgi:hypothetical protein